MKPSTFVRANEKRFIIRDDSLPALRSEEMGSFCLACGDSEWMTG